MGKNFKEVLRETREEVEKTEKEQEFYYDGLNISVDPNGQVYTSYDNRCWEGEEQIFTLLTMLSKEKSKKEVPRWQKV